MILHRVIRLFLSSPGDVPDERQCALDVIQKLKSDPLLTRHDMTIEAYAWERAGTPMLATMTPQDAINEMGVRPSQCDVTVVIFKARMGTPLPADFKKPDGSPYRSGTEWEY